MNGLNILERWGICSLSKVSIFLLLPILIYLNFQQPRESWTRFSTLKSKLELEMYSFMYSLNDYALMADGKEKITFFQNRITAIFSSNITQYDQNMKKHVDRENKHFFSKQ